MVRSNKSKNPARVGKGKVTPMQVAFLVDRYLCDNRFLETRSVFRSEASSLISKSPVRDVPNSLIPLDDILNEYICLKEQKMAVDQEKVRIEQEKIRVQNLLNGMQDLMDAYNSTAPVIPPAAIQAVSSIEKSNNPVVSPSGDTANNTPNVMQVSLPGNKRVGNFAARTISPSISKKRKSPEVSEEAPSVSKKVMKKIPLAKKKTNYLTFDTPEYNRIANESSTSVAKCLFNRTEMSPPLNSASPSTPQKQVSPQQEVTPTNHTIVTKERITVSPLKQIGSYSVERSRMVSSFSPLKSNKRDHVKGRLNFDDTEATMHLDSPATGDLGSSSSSSGSETDLFDIDFSNIDLLSESFSFSELLVDFDIGNEEIQDPCLPQSSNCRIDTASGGSSPESMRNNIVPDQVVSEYTSTVTETIQGNDMNTQQGSDSMTTVKSITKCLRILSPAKRQRATMD